MPTNEQTEQDKAVSSGVHPVPAGPEHGHSEASDTQDAGPKAEAEPKVEAKTEPKVEAKTEAKVDPAAEAAKEAEVAKAKAAAEAAKEPLPVVAPAGVKRSTGFMTGSAPKQLA